MTTLQIVLAEAVPLGQVEVRASRVDVRVVASSST